ncbi:MAG TPA: WYL domain-containing protein [Acidimicrobiales bacterium]|nr:WYL domain-containing protein [Acidimicrobiales bacterium]
MARPDRLERLTDLILVLLRAQRPLTLDAIADEVPGYPVDHDARRQAFERDKRLLRDEGIPVTAEPVEGQEQFGYRIHPDAFYLPELHLQPDEQAALHLAVAGVHLGDPSGRHALLKLGATGLGESRPVASLVPPPALVPLFEAVRSRAEVVFAYRGLGRRVAPGGLWFRSGHWYLVGWDRDRAAARTFRVDRMEGRPDPGVPGSGELPQGFDPSEAAPDDPWRIGEGDEGDALLWVDPVESGRVVEEVGESAVLERKDDGSVVLRLGVTSTDAFRSWVLGLLDHAEVIGPPPLRAAIVDWLDRLAAGSSPEAATVAPLPAGGVESAFPPASQDRPGSSDPSGRPNFRRDSSHRLRRLLAIVGWLARVGEARISDIADRFGIPEDELVHELELAACCGVPPYSPDVLMEIIVTDETVSAVLPEDLARPRRLTAAEGFALLAAGRTILAVPGADEHGTLARALTKLESVLGDHNRLVVALDAPAILPEVRRATEDHRQVEIEYHSASSDETTRRIVDPLQVVTRDGHWYLDAFCHSAAANRRFRIDRIRAMASTGSTPDPARLPPQRIGPDAFVPGPGAVAVRLALGPEASWVVDSIPVIGVRRDGGRVTEVTLAIGGTAWLERLLLQLGPHARVLDPAPLVDLGRDAATRILARYRALT